MAANLPELYKNNVGPVGDRQEKERDVLYTALMPHKWEITKKNQNISQSCLYNSISYCVHKREIHKLTDESCSTDNKRWFKKSERKDTDFATQDK